MKTICVIDDDALFQKMLNNHLTQMGYIVRSVFSGREIDSIREKPYAIILDHNLDEEMETGLQLLVKLKRRMPDVPVIYMTSTDDSSIREKAKKSGVADFIEKNSASLIRLRTAFDRIEQNATRSTWLKKIFGKGLDY